MTSHLLTMSATSRAALGYVKETEPRQPVLAITGLQFHDLLHTFTQQDVELDKLYVDVCVYNARIMGPYHIENVVELACRTALAYRGVAHVTVPVDIQSQPIKSARRSE